MLPLRDCLQDDRLLLTYFLLFASVFLVFCLVCLRMIKRKNTCKYACMRIRWVGVGGVDDVEQGDVFVQSHKLEKP